MTEDYEIKDIDCPKCGHHLTHSRSCVEMYCEDGYIDKSNDDPVNFREGREFRLCRECWGTGFEHWCPKCGHNLNAPVK